MYTHTYALLIDQVGRVFQKCIPTNGKKPQVLIKKFDTLHGMSVLLSRETIENQYAIKLGTICGEFKVLLEFQENANKLGRMTE